jgi:hypothetical protein
MNLNPIHIRHQSGVSELVTPEYKASRQVYDPHLKRLWEAYLTELRHFPDQREELWARYQGSYRRMRDLWYAAICAIDGHNPETGIYNPALVKSPSRPVLAKLELDLAKVPILVE